MKVYRRYFWDDSSDIPEEKAKEEGDYYVIELDDQERIKKCERFTENNLESYVEHRYKEANTTRITEMLIFDKNNTYQGKNIQRECERKEVISENYDKDGNLINLIRGTFDYIIKNGEIA